MDGLPTGVVSFVLTDVVGSTELWERAPEEMAVALERHDELVRVAVTAEGGVVLRTKGEGDSTFSVFARASDAVRAAYRLQRAMRTERWPAPAVIRVRAAVHTGEAVERDCDYFGPAVNRVARLRGVAEGGQVIVGAATATIVRNALPRGCQLVDVGRVELRGIAEAEPAWLLAAPDLDPVRTIRRGAAVDDRGVSRREAEVHALVGENLTNAEIAARLYISERTVESHVSSLLRKLGAGDRRQLASLAPQPALVVDARPPLPAMLELLADESTFVGRGPERELLRRQWELACAGHTLLVVLAGEAGIGKSRLVAELAAEVHADGGRVLYGACYEDVDQPYGPFAQAMATELGDVPIADVIRFDLDRETLGPSAVLDDIERWAVGVTPRLPTLLVVDDLHWSTSSTRDVLRHVVRRAARQPLLVIATTRDTAPDIDSELNALLDELERSPTVTRVRLSGLGPDEVAELVAVATADLDAIVSETGGNPLFVTRGGSLSTLLARRERPLDGETRAVLDLAATFGAEFDADLLAAGHGAPLLTVLELLEQAEAAGLVVPLPSLPGRFGFVHALFRSHRYAQLPLRRRLELHASAAAAMSTRAGDESLLSEHARHACLAVPVGDARAAVDLARQAAHLAEHASAYDEAANHYRRGLDAARSLDPPDPSAMLDLDVRLAAALYRRGDPQGVPMLLAAAQQARQQGNHAALVRAATSFSPFGATGAFGGPDPARLAVVEDAIAALDEGRSADRARLLVERAGHIGDVRVEESIDLVREAESIARDLGDDDVLGRVLLTSRIIGRHPSRRAEFERIGAELDGLGRRSGSLVLALAGMQTRAFFHLECGELGRWMALEDRMLDLLGDRRLPFFQLTALIYPSQRAFLDGDLQRAEELALATYQIARTIGHPPRVWSSTTVLANRRLQARDADLIDGNAAVVHGGGEVTIYRCTLAALLARSGRVDDAARTLDALRSDTYPVPKTFVWTTAMAELAEAAEVAGDSESAAHVISETRNYSGLIASTGAGITRPLDQALAQAALATGDAGLAEHYAAKAVAASRERRTPVFLCRELVFLAEARRRNGASPGELRPLIDEACAIAEPIGARVVTVDIERYGLPG